MEALKSFNFNKKHKIINCLRESKFRLFRRLSFDFAKISLPNKSKVGEHISTTIHGLKLIINPSIDNGVEWSLFETGTYEEGTLQFIKKNLIPNGVFVDVGANIGLMSIFTAKYFPNAKIISFEAHPGTFKIFSDNISLNAVGNISAIQKAVGSEKGETTIYENWDVNRGGASLVVKSESSKGIQVKLICLDDELDLNPSIVKIDVEGFELEVLKGAQNTIKKYQPIIIVEVSESIIDEYGQSNEIIEFIKTLGDYKFYSLAKGKAVASELVEIKSEKDIPAHDNVICIAS